MNIKDFLNKQRALFLTLFYLLVLYTFYVYTVCTVESFDESIHLPFMDQLYYFDVSLLFMGGLVSGAVLIKIDGRINIIMGIIMIIINVLWVPLLLARAIN